MTEPAARRSKSLSPKAKLRLLGMTDLHGHLRGYDYHRGQDDPNVGLTRVASLIRNARAEVANALLFDNGDTIQGTILADRAVAVPTDGQAHPMVDALNWLKVDAATIGNHEFNFGLPALRAAYARAEFPLVCANVLTRRGSDPSGDATLLPPWHILERQITDTDGHTHRLRVGVTGALPPQVMNWDHTHLDGHVTVRGIVESIGARVAEMRDKGADLVVVLCHSGLVPRGASLAEVTAEDVDAQAENAALAVARLPGVDAVVAGHTHSLFPSPAIPESSGVDPCAGTIHGTPVVLPGYHGSHLGVIDLDLTLTATGWRVAQGRAGVRPEPKAAGQVDEDPALLVHTAPAHAETLAHVAKPVGQTPTRLHTFFAMLDSGPALSLVAAAQTKAMANLLRGTRYESLPVLSVVSPFKCGARGGPEHFTDIPAGPLNLRNVADLYLYPNSLRGVLVNGRMLHNWLERSAGAFHQITPHGGAQDLVNHAQPSYDFDTIFGVTYAIDVTAPARYDPPSGQLRDIGARRVTDLCWNGRPVTEDDLFIAATNNYRAGGGGNFPDITVDAVVAETDQNVRDLLASYLSQGHPVPAPTPSWQFGAVPGASALIQTSPRARSATQDIARLGLVDRGDRDDGFAQFEFNLSNL